MFKKILLLACLCLPLSAAARIILIIGDSLSAAYGMPVEQGWVSLLQQRLDARGLDWQVVNSSISGDTTASARVRLAPALQEHEPSLVVIELGGNDGLRGLSLKAMKANLSAMIDEVQQRDARVLLVGVQLPPNYGPVYTKKFQGVYRELAKSRNTGLVVSLVDGIGTDATLMQADRIHPTAEAQPLMLDKVWAQLEPMLSLTVTGAASSAGRSSADAAR